MTNAQEIINQETTKEEKRGRRPLLENRDYLIDSLRAIHEGDEANMPNRRTILQLIEQGHVIAKPKERAEGQVGRVGSTYEVAGKSRTWLANALRKREADAVKEKAATLETLRKIVAQREEALAEAKRALAEFENETVEPETVVDVAEVTEPETEVTPEPEAETQE